MTILSSMDVLFQRSKKYIRLKVTKEVFVEEKPPIDLPRDAAFCGYILKCSLKLKSGFSNEVRPSIWNLVQVPGDGRIIVPVRTGAEVWPFIGRPVFSMDRNMVTCDVKTSAGFQLGYF